MSVPPLGPLTLLRGREGDWIVSYNKTPFPQESQVHPQESRLSPRLWTLTIRSFPGPHCFSQQGCSGRPRHPNLLISSHLLFHCYDLLDSTKTLYSHSPCLCQSLKEAQGPNHPSYLSLIFTGLCIASDLFPSPTTPLFMKSIHCALWNSWSAVNKIP